MSWKPERARVLRSSQPIPPAPTIRTFAPYKKIEKPQIYYREAEIEEREIRVFEEGEGEYLNGR